MKYRGKAAWSYKSEARLLELVRGYRPLWDHQQPDYPKIKKRQMLFSQIARDLGQKFPELQQLTGDQVRTKFKYLKSYFLRLYQKIQKAPSDSAEQLEFKWPFYDAMLFIVDSTGDTSGPTSSYVKPESEQLAKVEVWVTEAAHMLSHRSSPQPSPAGSIVEDDAPDLSNGSVKCLAMEKIKRPSKLETIELDSCGDSLNFKYIEKKTKTVSVEASSMGSLVEATMDKLSYNKQIWFMQKIVQLIAEVNDMPPEKV